MANYIVGDIQGCLAGLLPLLEKVNFDRKVDKLWAVGDLVARGPESLETLLFLRDLEGAFDCVLGNHDLHFLAIHAGLKAAKKSDLLEPLLTSKEVDGLAKWLRRKPLAVRPDKDTLISHAGLYPQWSFKKAIKLSDEVSEVLNGKGYKTLLSCMYGSEPRKWSNELAGYARLRFIINAFTRMRFITQQTSLEFDTKISPKIAAKNLKPWFEITNPKLKKQQTVVFGHWATLMGKTNSTQFIGLDTGYVWGNHMSLYHLESKETVISR